MIEFINVSKTFKTPDGHIDALDNISLHINKGSIYGIIGLSGAGKSTLLRCINRLEEPTSGSVLINGVDIIKLNSKALREERKKIGMIFQSFNLLNSKTVFQNVAFPLEICGIPSKEIRTRVEEMLELVGISDKAKSYPYELSGGQKQRVGIARALATNPEILLCDEATSALDPKTTNSILSLLYDINRKFNITIVLITHQMDVIRQICTEAAIIENGTVIERGNVKDLLANPKTSTAKLFLGADDYDLNKEVV